MLKIAIFNPTSTQPLSNCNLGSTNEKEKETKPRWKTLFWIILMYSENVSKGWLGGWSEVVGSRLHCEGSSSLSAYLEPVGLNIRLTVWSLLSWCARISTIKTTQTHSHPRSTTPCGVSDVRLVACVLFLGCVQRTFPSDDLRAD